MSTELRNAPQKAMRNRDEVENAFCGCYHCLETFEGKEIKDWTDGGKTALCPRCDCDCVLPNPDPHHLEFLNKYWIGEK
jgi:hypothetical protein